MRRIFLVAVLWCLATGAQAASTIVPGLLPVGIPPNSGLINQNFQNAINDVNALQNLNAGVTAPSNPSLGYFWLSTPQNATTYPLNLWDGTRWANVASLDSVNHIWMPPIGGGVPPTILSATTTDLGSVPQAFVYVSGTNPIQSFGSSAPVGTIKVVDFLATTTLTSNPSLLILPGSVNLTTAPGDTLLAAQIAAGQWALISYNRASGGTIIQPVIGTPPTVVGDCVAWANTAGSFLSDTGHPCASGGGGNVNGPSMSTVGNCALWANTSGTILSNSTGPCVLGPSVSVSGDVALFNSTTGNLLSDAGGPPLVASQPVAPGLLLNSTSTTSYGWAVPSSVVPGTLAGLQIICADACGSDTPAIIGGGLVTVVQNCNISTPCQFSPDTGTQSVIWEGCGAGASGGGASASDSTTHGSLGSGGGAGAWFRMWQHTSGAGQTIEVGIGAVAGAAGANGNPGGSTSIGGIFEAGGGQAGIQGSTPSTNLLRPPSGPAIVDYDPSMSLIVPIVANAGAAGFYQNAQGWSGAGGSSPFGAGGVPQYVTGASKQVGGIAGTGYCSGGSGGISANNASGAVQAGAPGNNAILLAWELTNP